MSSPTIDRALGELERLDAVNRSVLTLPRREAVESLHKIEAPNPKTLDELGKMSAEAVLAQYEAAAKAVEAMGISVKERVRNIAAALLECDVDMKEIAETAAMIREKGHHVQAQIEEASALSSNIRRVCADFRKQVSV